MLLVFDVGNTNMVIGVYEDKTLVNAGKKIGASKYFAEGNYNKPEKWTKNS